VELLLRMSVHYSDAEIAVAVVLADAMMWDSGLREFNCFLLINTIATRRKKSRRTVQRALDGLCRGSRRIFESTPAPVGGKLTTRGRAHKCNRYSLLLGDPGVTRG